MRPEITEPLEREGNPRKKNVYRTNRPFGVFLVKFFGNGKIIGCIVHWFPD